MKRRWLKKIILFILILIGVNELCRWYFLNVSNQNNPLLLTDAAYHQTKKPLEALFLGHSRGKQGIIDSGNPRIFNFCSGGESNIYSYYKLKYILEEEQQKAGVVVLPCGHGTFNMLDVNHTVNSFYWRRYVDYIEMGSHKGKTSEYTLLATKAYLFPYFERPRHYTDVAWRTFRKLPTPRTTLEGKSEEQRLELAKDAIRTGSAKKNHRDSVSLLYLRKTIELCRQYQQPLVFVKYPLSKYYLTAFEQFIASRETPERPVEEILAEMDPNVQLLDYQELFIDSTAYFRDVHHLNAKGAKALTTRLLKDLGIAP